MQQFEIECARLIQKVLREGEVRVGRNGQTTSFFGMSITLEHLDEYFPLIQGRKMYLQGILGEFAAFVRCPTNVKDFEQLGCNYWEKWADKGTGELRIDYGNTWFDFEGFNQIERLKYNLANNPNNRRMIVSSWRPHKQDELSLPCCHYNYQFYVRNSEYLDMVWTQRSVDMMIGLPSDFILAACWLMSLAKEFNFKPGKVKMDLGDCHVYDVHYDQALEYLNRVLEQRPEFEPVRYVYEAKPGTVFEKFHPAMVSIGEYSHMAKLDMEVVA